MQDRASILAGDARLLAFTGTKARIVVVIGVSMTLFLTLLIVVTAFVVTSEDGVRTLTSDFRVFWATARLVLAGEPMAAFDASRIDLEYNTVSGDWMPWLYPPGYMFLVTPFGALPYAVAYLAMTLLSIAAMVLAARPFVGEAKPVWAAMALAPAYMPALVIGQNSLVWLAVLLAALAALRSGSAILAGVIIGCLTLKPQFGMLVPIALLAAGQWRTIFAAAGTTVALAVLPTLVVGIDYWPAMAERIGQHADRMVQLVDELVLTVGPFFFAVFIGLSTPVALKLQWVITLLAAVSVFVFWRSKRISFDAKVALLLTAILLSAPFLWYYEAAMMAAIGLFLARAGILTTRFSHLVLLTLLWIGAGLQSLDLVFPGFEDRYLGAVIVTPVLLISFMLCWHHYLQGRRGPTGAAGHTGIQGTA